MSPSLYDQEVPFGDHLRGLVTYALLIKPRIIATQTVFNSRTLVTKVLCPWDPVKEIYTLNLQVVSRLDLWVDHEFAGLPGRARLIRQAFEEQSRHGTFLLDEIPEDALKLLLGYYDNNPHQLLPIDGLPNRSNWSGRFREGLIKALNDKRLPVVLGDSPCSWLKQ